ncbi:unnamed protein product [Spirodela intermedia]|uniref:Rhodanese domain-containing protein n=1 Tax=Spirodela intermedia TaxID=51605 RepID=A0A7I8ILR8_SPIIN|nr:unnamed protein product [Spirodela intermedia]CAA6657911.1 unnamed protein product [Spirodela intermedia]
MEEDFLKGHVEGAVNVPYYSDTPEGSLYLYLFLSLHLNISSAMIRRNNSRKGEESGFLDQVSTLVTRDETFIVGCMTGNRSKHATGDLLLAGFVNAKNMKAGYRSWLQKDAAEVDKTA